MHSRDLDTAFGTALGYTGQYGDPVYGGYLLGNGYRVYLPGIMRFASPDDLSPFGWGGANPYAYCGGDPITLLDPTGHVPTAFLSDLEHLAEDLDLEASAGERGIADTSSEMAHTDEPTAPSRSSTPLSSTRRAPGRLAPLRPSIPASVAAIAMLSGSIGAGIASRFASGHKAAALQGISVGLGLGSGLLGIVAMGPMLHMDSSVDWTDKLAQLTDRLDPDSKAAWEAYPPNSKAAWEAYRSHTLLEGESLREKLRKSETLAVPVWGRLIDHTSSSTDDGYGGSLRTNSTRYGIPGS